MILKHLRLLNFRRYAELTLEFPENVIGIIGRNGAGKSTLLEALAWALYGSRAARTDKQLIRRQQAAPTAPCEIELAFSLAGEDYLVRRTMRGANAAVEAALYRAGESATLAVRESGVNAALAQLLGLDHKSFEASIFAKQKELAALSALTDEPRRKLVSRLINLEAIDLARQNVLADATQKRKFLEGARAYQANIGELEQQFSHLHAERQAAEELLHQRQEEEQHSAQRAEQQRRLWQEESQRRDRARELHAQLQNTQGQVQLVQQQMLQTEKERAELVAQQTMIARLAPARGLVEKLRQEKDGLEAQRRALVERSSKQQLAKSLAEQIAVLHREAEPLQQSLTDLQQLTPEEQATEARRQEAQAHLQKCREESIDLSNRASVVAERGKETKERMQRVQALGAHSPCPVCTRPLQEHYEPVVAEMEKSLSLLRQEYAALAEHRKAAEQRLQEAELVEKSLQQAQQRLSGEREKFRQHQDRLAALQKRLLELQQQFGRRQTEIAQMGAISFEEARFAEVGATLAEQEQKLRELLRLEGLVENLPVLEARQAQQQSQKRELEETSANLQNTLAALQYQEENYLTQQRAYDEARAEHLRQQKAVGETQATLASLTAQCGQLETSLAQARERAAQIARTESEVMLLEALQEHFKNFRAALAGRLRPLIAARASEILRLATNGRYALLELDESYNIFLFDQNQKFALARFSGGEQDLLNLCLRVAISQVIAQRSGRPPLQFIVLDEIFGSQDEERKSLLLSTLQHLHSHFRQIFLITHEQSIKDSLPVVFEVQMQGDCSEVKMLS